MFKMISEDTRLLDTQEQISIVILNPISNGNGT